MRQLKLCRDDGSAALEFLTAGFLLLVPLVYLVLAMAVIQAGALAVEGASRQAARVFVQAPDAATAQSRAQTAVDFTLRDFGVHDSGVSDAGVHSSGPHSSGVGSATTTMTISCRPDPAVCLTRRGFVTVTVTAAVSLPLVPNVLALHTPLAVRMSASSTEQVSRFWGAG